ncbi:unnamed protein product [Chironomus riparius]|uniref:Transmembrane protein 222 n=1 Tax=Chironomus riparius TaxID=315576 RepID=A0A9N9S8P9_9DIPT|nr:unnamed protein product [Chironomus riparius]
MDLEANMTKIDYDLHRYPFCLVWTPIPLITWLLPFVGHMGIATSQGIIRDFAGPYFVSEDEMGFAWPTRYLQLDISKVGGGSTTWDDAVQKASTEYSKRMHNLFWDNCHSHCGMALSLMRYGGSTWWSMVRLAAWMFLFGKYVGFSGFVKTWLPFVIIVTSGILIWKLV